MYDFLKIYKLYRKISADPGKFNVPEWNRRAKMNRWRFQNIQKARDDVKDSLSVESRKVSKFVAPRLDSSDLITVVWSKLSPLKF